MQQVFWWSFFEFPQLCHLKSGDRWSLLRPSIRPIRPHLSSVSAAQSWHNPLLCEFTGVYSIMKHWSVEFFFGLLTGCWWNNNSETSIVVGEVPPFTLPKINTTPKWWLGDGWEKTFVLGFGPVSYRKGKWVSFFSSKEITVYGPFRCGVSSQHTAPKALQQNYVYLAPPKKNAHKIHVFSYI